ncbi:PilZ domain-containing protein [Thermodesulfobacteriota bacterium]
MAANRKLEVKAKDVLRDINEGISNDVLMKRYGLSLKGLRSLFRKMLDARLLSGADLEGRMPPPVEGEEEVNRRAQARCYPYSPFPILDVDDLTTDAMVHDISENGLKASGMTPRLGERKNLLIHLDEFEDVLPFTFEAQCRWTKVESDGVRVSGFEITEISETGAKQLKRLLSSLAVCD